MKGLKLETLAQTRLPDGGQAWHARVYLLAINFIILRIRIIFMRCRARAGLRKTTDMHKGAGSKRYQVSSFKHQITDGR